MEETISEAIFKGIVSLLLFLVPLGMLFYTLHKMDSNDNENLNEQLREGF